MSEKRTEWPKDKQATSVLEALQKKNGASQEWSDSDLHVSGEERTPDSGVLEMEEDDWKGDATILKIDEGKTGESEDRIDRKAFKEELREERGAEMLKNLGKSIEEAKERTKTRFSGFLEGLGTRLDKMTARTKELFYQTIGAGAEFDEYAERQLAIAKKEAGIKAKTAGKMALAGAGIVGVAATLKYTVPAVLIGAAGYGAYKAGEAGYGAAKKGAKAVGESYDVAKDHMPSLMNMARAEVRGSYDEKVAKIENIVQIGRDADKEAAKRIDQAGSLAYDALHMLRYGKIADKESPEARSIREAQEAYDAIDEEEISLDENETNTEVTPKASPAAERAAAAAARYAEIERVRHEEELEALQAEAQAGAHEKQPLGPTSVEIIDDEEVAEKTIAAFTELSTIINELGIDGDIYKKELSDAVKTEDRDGIRNVLTEMMLRPVSPPGEQRKKVDAAANKALNILNEAGGNEWSNIKKGLGIKETANVKPEAIDSKEDAEIAEETVAVFTEIMREIEDLSPEEGAKIADVKRIMEKGTIADIKQVLHDLSRDTKSVTTNENDKEILEKLQRYADSALSLIESSGGKVTRANIKKGVMLGAKSDIMKTLKKGQGTEAVKPVAAVKRAAKKAA